MLEWREDAPIGSLIFWSIALVIWIIVRIGSKKKKNDDPKE